MRWDSTIRKSGDIRIYSTFLLYPHTLKDKSGKFETRWLESVKIKQEFRRSTQDDWWEDLEWVD